MRRRFQSLRVRMPLSLVLVSLLTFSFLSLVVGVQTSLNLEKDLKRSLRAQAHALAPILTDALLHDDVWTAYTALHGPRRARSEDDASGFRLVLDEQGRVFVSDHPRRFPLATPWSADNTPGPVPPPATSRMIRFDGRLGYWLPLRADQTPIGTLVIAARRGAVQARLLEILGSALVGMTALLLLIVPLGWLWGARLVQPLVRLAECMRQVEKDELEGLQCPVTGGNDEIGQLSRRFRLMLEELRQKRALERQMVAQDRLAAIGRLAGGVAHEINNPLAGMLVAIDTYRRVPAAKKNPDRTLALVERGLQQIQATVSALLVECRLEKRRFSPADLEDIRRLVTADRAAAQVEIHWRGGIDSDLPLPANALRQILLNLTLNAVQAAAEQPPGRVEIALSPQADRVQVDVNNSGRPIPPQELEHIFEPFHTSKPGGNGLGLWITYQIVEQLHGEILARSEAAGTHFQVTLPYPAGEAP